MPYDIKRAKRDAEKRWNRQAAIRARYRFQRDEHGRPLCTYCGAVVKPPKQRWCGKACVEKYLDETDWGRIRKRIYVRDGGRCRRCSTDFEALGRLLDSVAGAYLDDGPDDVIFVNKAAREAWLRAAGFNSWLQSTWEVNHIVAVADGGTDEHENLELLCVPCHKAETVRQQRRWARERRGQLALIPDASVPRE